MALCLPYEIPLVPTVSKNLSVSVSVFRSLSPLCFQINASHLDRANSQKVQQAQMALMHKCNLAKGCQRQARQGSKKLQCTYRKSVIGKVNVAAVRARCLLPVQH